MKNLVIILLFVPFLATAQKYDYNWPFGYTFSNNPIDSVFGISFINFNTSNGNPNVQTNYQIIYGLINSNTSISNKDGLPLFLFDGYDLLSTSNVWVINGQNMAVPKTAGMQSSIGIPHYDDKNCYWLIHKDIELFPEKGYVAGIRLLSSLLSFKPAELTGSVIEKRNILLNDTISYNKVTAARHANGFGG
jgi:hypothetical protein